MTKEKKERKRIYNPFTKEYYEVRQRTTSSGRKGLWSSDEKERKEKKWIW